MTKQEAKKDQSKSKKRKHAVVKLFSKIGDIIKNSDAKIEIDGTSFQKDKDDMVLSLNKENTSTCIHFSDSKLSIQHNIKPKRDDT